MRTFKQSNTILAYWLIRAQLLSLVKIACNILRFEELKTFKASVWIVRYRFWVLASDFSLLTLFVQGPWPKSTALRRLCNGRVTSKCRTIGDIIIFKIDFSTLSFLMQCMRIPFPHNVADNLGAGSVQTSSRSQRGLPRLLGGRVFLTQVISACYLRV